MKTTLDLRGDLLMEAKAVAAKRRTTFKAMVEHALRREIQGSVRLAPEEAERYETGPFGILRLKRSPGATVTNETIRKIQDEIDEEELDHALKLAGKR